MKKLSTCLILVSVFAMGVNAQVINPVKRYPVSHQDLANWKATHLPKLGNTNRNVYELYIDYAAANFDTYGFAWYFNTNYVAADTAGGHYGYMNYIAVAIKNIAGYTDPNDILNTYTDWFTLGLADTLPSNVEITVDSIFVHVGQENNSGENDTLAMQLVKLTSNAPSLTSQVLWQQRDSFSAPLSYPSGQWTTDQVVIVYTPGYVSPPTQRIAGVLKYWNKNKQDTMIVTAQFVDNGAHGADNPSTFFTSYVRPCYLNNIYWTGQLSYGPGQYFEAEDWDLWYKVTLHDPLGINDNFNNLLVHYITPNPASSHASIWFGLAKSSDVTINLLDVSGKYIKTIKKGQFAAGSFFEDLDVNSLNNGLYLVSVQADNNTPVISKLVVSK